jgi:hypothetical protein
VPLASRRKMKSIEKIYESVQPPGKTGARHTSRRRGWPHGGAERLQHEATLGLQSLSTIPTASYRQLSRPEPAAVMGHPGAQAAFPDRKQSQYLPQPAKMSRSAQRGGGRLGRTQISDQARVLKLDPERADDFMTVQSHANGYQATFPVNSGQGSLNREERLRTLAAGGATGASSLRSDSRGENAPTAEPGADSYG